MNLWLDYLFANNGISRVKNAAVACASHASRHLVFEKRRHLSVPRPICRLLFLRVLRSRDCVPAACMRSE